MIVDTRNMYLFMGAPGSGKGTLSGHCVREFGWKQLSTGNLCRKHVSEGTKIGKEIDFAIKSGKLITDRLVTDMVNDWLNEAAQEHSSVILDGYPRTEAQAQSLNELLTKNNKAWKLTVVKLVVSDEMVVDRLSKRYVCTNRDCQAVYSSDSFDSDKILCEDCSSPLERRKDDRPEAIKERLVIYHENVDAMIKYFNNDIFPVIELTVEKPPYEIFKDFKQLIGS